MNRKGAHPLAVVMVVFLTITLFGFTWFSFQTNSGDLIVQIESARIADNIYAKESNINFYISEMVEKAASNIVNSENTKIDFIENMKNELSIYRVGDSYIIDEFGQIESQLNEDTIVINGNEIALTLELVIEGEAKIKEYTSVKAVYRYSRAFKGRMKG